MHYKFVLVDAATGNDQANWILPPPVTVGRSSDVDVSIGDASISRRHCQFSIGGLGALVVRDLGSMNGVYVDNQRVNKAIIKPGDTIQIGAISLRVEWTEDPVVESPSVDVVHDVTTTQPMKIPPRKKES